MATDRDTVVRIKERIDAGCNYRDIMSEFGLTKYEAQYLVSDIRVINRVDRGVLERVRLSSNGSEARKFLVKKGLRDFVTTASLLGIIPEFKRKKLEPDNFRELSKMLDAKSNRSVMVNYMMDCGLKPKVASDYVGLWKRIRDLIFHDQDFAQKVQSQLDAGATEKDIKKDFGVDYHVLMVMRSAGLLRFSIATLHAKTGDNSVPPGAPVAAVTPPTIKECMARWKNDGCTAITFVDRSTDYLRGILVKGNVKEIEDCCINALKKKFEIR